MSIRTYLSAFAAFLIVLPFASAQEAVPYTSVGVSEWVSIVNIPAIPNAPFSATTLMDNSNTLADGTIVTTTTMTTIARDSQGRTHNESRYYLRPADHGEGHVRSVTIFDPATGSKTTLVPAKLLATVEVSRAPEPPTGLVAVVTGPEHAPQREDLGMSSIDGLAVHGFRQSRTIPEGQDGNSRSITIADEYWYSDQLHMNITVKHTDPRHGTQSVVLTRLKLEEPDPKMFEIPPTYAVRNSQNH